MSHTTTIKGVPINDPAAIRSAVTSLREERNVNCELRENEAPRAYSPGQIGKCDFVVRLNDGKYDMGLKLDQESGNYEIKYDEWHGYVEEHLAVKGVKRPSGTSSAQWGVSAFYQEYSRHAATNAAVAQGFMVDSCSFDEEMNLNLVLSD